VSFISIHSNIFLLQSEGLSGAECVNVCQEAAMLAMEEDVAIAAVGARHFDQALREVRPRITEEMIAFYERFREGSKANVI
jgi:AAA family ATPase